MRWYFFLRIGLPVLLIEALNAQTVGVWQVPKTVPSLLYVCVIIYYVVVKRHTKFKKCALFRWFVTYGNPNSIQNWRLTYLSFQVTSVYNFMPKTLHVTVEFFFKLKFSNKVLTALGLFKTVVLQCCCWSPCKQKVVSLWTLCQYCLCQLGQLSPELFSQLRGGTTKRTFRLGEFSFQGLSALKISCWEKLFSRVVSFQLHGLRSNIFEARFVHIHSVIRVQRVANCQNILISMIIYCFF